MTLGYGGSSPLGPSQGDSGASEVAALRGRVAELDAENQRLLSAVEAGHFPSPISDLYPEDNVRFCDLDDERWPCAAVRRSTRSPE